MVAIFLCFLLYFVLETIKDYLFMLQHLKINNIALIEDLNLTFYSKLNVLTGETGAGKSIIIDSLNFLLGARADKTLIRSGQTQAKVVGVFVLEEKVKEVTAFFEKNNLEYDDTVIISRQMSENGKSVTQINGEFVTASMLKELTSYLIDIHGQNEHQLLLNTVNQLEMIDAYKQKEINNKKQAYQEVLHKLKEVNQHLLSFGGSEEDRLRQIDLLEYEVNEINLANITQEEEEELTLRLKKLQNIEKIANNVSEANVQLESGQGGVLASLTSALHNLNAVSAYDSTIETLVERLNSSKLELEDVIYELNDMASSLEFDEKEYEQVDERLELIKKLKRKYGGSVEQVLTYLKEASEKLHALKNSKEEIDKLQKEKRSILKELLEAGVALRKERETSANELTSAILEELKDLGMPHAKLVMQFCDLPSLEKLERAYKQNGLDEVEFLFSANLGEPVKPLNKIISGGEMSRVMLSFKTVLTGDIPTFVFDEIDAGISGKMAQAVSKKLAKISRNHQILVVSHLPQIAAMADNHFFIEKTVIEGKTKTHVELIKEDKVIEEIARMLSAEKLTDASKNNAKQLKEDATLFKNNF